MVFCFRIRFHLDPGSRIGSAEAKLAFPPKREGEEVVLQGAEVEKPISENDVLLVHGRPYSSEEEASHAGVEWVGLIKKAFARRNLGADFGDRSPQGFVTEHGLKLFEQQGGGRKVVNDVHGLMVYEEPRPLFVRVGPAKGIKSLQEERLLQAIAVAVELGAVMTERDQFAYDLYSASTNESSADARLALLMMAVETMLDPEPRSEEVRAHIDHLVAETKASGLPDSEIRSILGTLRWLYRESIRRAGRKLASRLEGREYMGESPTEFFTNSYTLRSRLFHGEYPRPEWSEVVKRAGSLELFVRDLLSLELIHRIPD
jgi:hypothetical protein